MGRMGLLGRMSLMGLIVLVAACTSDVVQPVDGVDQEQEQGMPAPFQVVSYLKPFEESLGETRTDPPAWLPAGYSVDTNHKAVGAFFTKSGSDVDTRRIWYNDFGTPDNPSDDKWYINGEGIPTGDYYIYGFMPYNTAKTVTCSANTTFEDGAILTFTGLGSMMSKDVCVMVGARHGSDADTPEYPGLRIGQFGCSMKSGGSGNENYLFLLFEHIYARLDFSFRVDEEYAKLRIIKLRELSIKGKTYTELDQSDATDMKKEGSITVYLKANSTNTSPIVNDIKFTSDNASGDMDPVILFEGEEELPSDKYPAGDPLAGEYKYTDETGYVPYYNFAGNDMKVLYVLRSTYDVYDKQGNLIRSNCVADNVIIPNEVLNQSQLDRGKKYRIKLTVKPTYLYVMSEPDLNNPTVVIN